VDRACGELARRGVIVERELFGTLSAVLMPPSISLAVSLLEAILASRAGVKCVSIAYPQGGNAAQDIAALRSIRCLAKRYLPERLCVFPVLHEYMGPFPKERAKANALILYGALTGKLGRASKVVTKTYDEAFGIPTLKANVDGILLSKMADDDLLTFIRLDESRIAEEMDIIATEVDEILRPALDGHDLAETIVSCFERGYLDIPFSTSMSAQSRVIPMRDRDGAIRMLDSGGLCLFDKSIDRNRRMLAAAPQTDVIEKVLKDIQYFL
jgi:methylaspartate mutase epsilon subunit